MSYEFVIQSEAKDLGSIHMMHSGFFGQSPQQLVFAALRSATNDEFPVSVILNEVKNL